MSPSDGELETAARRLAGPVRWEGLGPVTQRYWLDHATRQPTEQPAEQTTLDTADTEPKR